MKDRCQRFGAILLKHFEEFYNENNCKRRIVHTFYDSESNSIVKEDCKINCFEEGGAETSDMDHEYAPWHKTYIHTHSRVEVGLCPIDFSCHFCGNTQINDFNIIKD